MEPYENMLRRIKAPEAKPELVVLTHQGVWIGR
jgi:hypothetical protein